MSTWVAGITDKVSGPASTMRSALAGLGRGASATSQSLASVGSGANKGASSMRALHSEVDTAKAKLARLQATKKALEASGSVDIKLGKSLNKDINAEKSTVNKLTKKIVKGGGAGFDKKGYDADVKAAKKAEKDKEKEESKAAKDKEKRHAAISAGAAKASQAAWRGVTMVAAVGVAAGAAIVGAGVAGFSMMATRALETQRGAQARLGAINARFNLGLRDMSKNVNLTPFLNALDRGAAMFDKNTATGKIMGAQVKRAFDGAGRAVTALLPYAEKAFAGLLVWSIKAETAVIRFGTAGMRAIRGVFEWLGATRGRLSAVRSVSSAVGTAFGLIGTAFKAVVDTLGDGAVFAAVAVALGALGAQGLVAAAGAAASGAAFLAANPAIAATGVAVAAVIALYQQWNELKRTWDDNSWEQIKNQFSGDEDAMSKRQGIVTGDDYDKKHKLGKYAEEQPQLASVQPPALASSAQTMSSADGRDIGVALGQGIASGIASQSQDVNSAASDLVKGGVKAGRAAGDIHSPSRVTRKYIGRELGRGVALGITDEKTNVNDAASDAFMPNVNMTKVGSGSSGKGATGRMTQFNNCFNGAVFGGDVTQSTIEAMMTVVLDKETQMLGEN